MVKAYKQLHTKAAFYFNKVFYPRYLQLSCTMIPSSWIAKSFFLIAFSLRVVVNSTIPFFTDTTFMVHISRDSCICEGSLIKHSNKLASCQINTKKILTPTDLNKNWSVKTLIHSEFHACMKQSKLKFSLIFWLALTLKPYNIEC